MRVLILHFLDTRNAKNITILRNLQAASENNGHQVTLMNAKDVGNLQFPMYEYVCIVTKSAKLFGAKLPSQMGEILNKHGTLSGKKGCSLVVKGGFSSDKMNTLVMKAMEKEGIFIDYSQVIESPEHAKSIGKKIG
ncbi:MAG: hypothetical protein BKP49_04830 [Treponema sp. CETP13]|nr:MAG: hypothetical protein BKP49_04830 [Treponema sp. CETP13]